MEGGPTQDVNAEDFKTWLKAEAELDDDTVDRLIDAGFDDYESLALAQEETFQFLGFNEPKAVFAKIRGALSEEILDSVRGKDPHLLAQGILDQDGQDMEDL